MSVFVRWIRCVPQRPAWFLVAASVLMGSVAWADTPLTEMQSWKGPVDVWMGGWTMAADLDSDGNADVMSLPARFTVTSTSIPLGSELVDAVLFWSGSQDNGGITLSSAADTEITLTIPGRTPAGISADACWIAASTSNADQWVCSARVTDQYLIPGSTMYGTYEVHDYAGRTSDNAVDSASAALMLVYANNALPPRRIQVLAGNADLGGLPSFGFDGFDVIAGASARFAMYSFGAGRATGGEMIDVLNIGGNPTLSLADANNPSGNVFNGTVNMLRPPATGVLRTDIDSFAISSVLSTADSGVLVHPDPGSETVWATCAVMAADDHAPILSAQSNMVWNLSIDADGDGLPSVGDSVRISIHLQNSGNQSALPTVLMDIPAAAASWLLVDAGGGTDASTAAQLQVQNLSLAPGAFANIVLDMVLADINDRTVVPLWARWTVPSDGGLPGFLRAPDLIIYKDLDGDGTYDNDDCGPNNALVYGAAVDVCDGIDNNCDSVFDPVSVTVAWPAGTIETTTGSNDYAYIDVPHNAPITDLDIQVDVRNDYIGDVTLTVQSPAGTSAQFARFHGGSGCCYSDTVFDDEATVPVANGSSPFSGSYIPYSPLAIFDGQNPHGQWRLTMYDWYQSNNNDIRDWELRLDLQGNVDLDNDGSSFCSDCNDDDPTSYPGNLELCDGIDNNCDGTIPANESDSDGDGVRICAGDCNDSDPTVFSGAAELCDGLDNDCNALVPANENDTDMDGSRICAGDCNDADPSLEGLDRDGDGNSICAGDCDDLNAIRANGAAELCDRIDNNCDLLLPPTEIDDDSDGATECEGDCNDLLAAVVPGAIDSCNGIDDDCDGRLDPVALTVAWPLGATETTSGSNDYAYINVPQTAAIYDVNVQANVTNSYIGDVTLTVQSPLGSSVALTRYHGGSGCCYTNTIFDDEAAVAIAGGTSPFAGSYRPDDALSDFDGQNPVGQWRLAMYDWYQSNNNDILAWQLNFRLDGSIDNDGDGVAFCADCNDNNAVMFPGNPEVCDGIDNNCDSVIPANEGDVDADGTRICAGDCVDANPSIYPGAPEICDGLDNNCAGSVPANEIDNDMDGSRACNGDCDDNNPAVEGRDRDGDGNSICQGDCNDLDPVRYIGAVELCDRIDNNCDQALPAPETDDDGDGISECEGDCNDGSAAIVPGATDSCNGIDDDCDGIFDPVAITVPWPAASIETTSGSNDYAYIDVPYSSPIADVDVQVDVSNSYIGDVTLTVQSPMGDSVQIARYHGAGGCCYTDTVFDDEAATAISSGSSPFAGSYRPYAPLAPFDGENPQGRWRLTMYDWYQSNGNDIRDWELRLDLRGDTDADNDGSSFCADCNDNDPTSYPGNTELCDGIDNNCSAGVPADERDTDGDGVRICAGDCNDADATIYLGALELCDGVDNNCDGTVPLTEQDVDGDGSRACNNDCDDGNAALNTLDIDGDGNSTCQGDCADNDPIRYVGAGELCDGIDNNCDLVLPLQETDDDGDGTSECQGDCNDADAVVRPGATDSCNGLDDNCDGVFDPVSSVVTWPAGSVETTSGSNDYAYIDVPFNAPIADIDVQVDVRNDYIGDVTLTVQSPLGSSVQIARFHGGSGCCYSNTVFDDEAVNAVTSGSSPFDGSYRPYTPLTGFDGQNPQGRWQLTMYDWYQSNGNDIRNWQLRMTVQGNGDSDGDGSALCADCDDTNPARFPGNTELCDGIDNNCSDAAVTDESDNDGDGQRSCGGDCNDSDPSIYQGAPELCDGVDNDCDGTIPTDEQDVDRDGSRACDADCDDNNVALNTLDVDNDGHTTCQGDCDDLAAVSHAGASEACDRIDNNCDQSLPADEIDDDADGVSECEGDCNDLTTAVVPGAADTCNGIDDDCDGVFDPVLFVVPWPAGTIETTSGNNDYAYIDVPYSSPIADIDVQVDVRNDYLGDVTLTVQSPQGGSVQIARYHGGSGCCYSDTVFDDEAAQPVTAGTSPFTGVYRPFATLTPFDGQNPQGRWQLTMNDWYQSNGNDIRDWELRLRLYGTTDADGDGSALCADCDDNDATNFPGNAEVCDGIDNNCGVGTPMNEYDTDGDGVRICGGDCNDLDATSWPGASEICDGIDNNCDGMIPANEIDADADSSRICEGDCDDSDPSLNTIDSDGDGDTSCGVAGTLVDCDDHDPLRYANSAELCDHIDNNCDGAVPANEVDDDGDGVAECEGDCDDADSAVVPGAQDHCNNIDDDCDGTVDPYAVSVGFTNNDDYNSGNFTYATIDITETAAIADVNVQVDVFNDYIGDVILSIQSPAGTIVTLAQYHGGSGCCYDNTVFDDESNRNLAGGTSSFDGFWMPDSALSDFDGESPLGRWTLRMYDWYQSNGNRINDWDLHLTLVGAADIDNDGVATCADCNDNEAAAFPGNNELCDGLDNDCNPATGAGPSGLFSGENDVDGDGIRICGGDCDDNDVQRFFGNNEICDEIDNNCDGFLLASEVDNDLDGFVECTAVQFGLDCDDNDNSVYPGAPEICDAKDNDCDGVVDPGQFDGDGDGFSLCAGDCDDGNLAFHPQASELCDGVDYDCDGVLLLETDDDQDGVTECGGDCDDGNATNYPGNSESCDGVDEDCDGIVDDGVVFVDYYVDADGDGAGTMNGSPTTTCAGPPAGNWVINNLDCDDNNAVVYLGANELCDDLDNDCDGTADDGLIFVDSWPDLDADGLGDMTSAATATCHAVPAGMVLNNLDCDDDNAVVYLGATELCDDLDNDCDGTVDDGVVFFDSWPDLDRDGLGDMNRVPTGFCTAVPFGMVLNNQDCDDNNAAVYLGATELCDGLDNDCDGTVDDGILFFDAWPDVDGDGLGDMNSAPTGFCTAVPLGMVQNMDDCDDADATVYLGASELCDGLDNDCDGMVDNAVMFVDYWLDQDADGMGAMNGTPTTTCEGAPLGMVDNANDCDDNNAVVFLGAQELCDSLDNDCDRAIDDGLIFVDYYRDEDGDGTGDASGVGSGAPTTTCDGPPPGLWVTDNTDCDDQNAAMLPGAIEICDGLDNDCDSAIDDGLMLVDYWVDNDGDGSGDTHTPPTTTCDGPPPGVWVVNNSDCDDVNATVFAGAVETCDGLDNDCDGRTDDGLVFVDYYPDADDDGFGALNSARQATCDGPPPGLWVEDNTDCEDENATVYPGAAEVCDGLDNDCDGTIDDGLVFVDYYPDADGDGSGDAHSLPTWTCDGPPPGDWADNHGDCDDGDPTSFYGAPELCDGIDNNCDGRDDEAIDDEDGDGLSTCEGDCDDENAEVLPLADELCDGLDNDCDGIVPDDELDMDRDGFLICGGDCDDGDADVNPEAPEDTKILCIDGLDNNCNNAIDELDESCVTFADINTLAGGCYCSAPSSSSKSKQGLGLCLLVLGTVVLTLRRR